MNSSEIAIIIKRYSILLDKLLNGGFIRFNSENFRTELPQQSGVYLISEDRGDVFETIYIVQSNNLQNRIYRNHLMGCRRVSTLKNKLIKIGKFIDESAVKKFLHENCMVQYVIIENESDRDSFEHFAISILKPKFND